ncbi:MAG: ABC transporter permease subunit [Halobacteriaceae archaeon]
MHWLIKRTSRFLATLFTVLTVTFFMIQAMPGGPASYLRSQLRQQGVSQAEIEQRVRAYLTFQPDQPVTHQYVDYVWSLLHGNLGQSIWYGEPVTRLLSEAVPWTVFIMGTGIFLTFTVGILVGALMAYREGTLFDSAATVVAIVSNSVPYYIAALLLIFMFATGNLTNWFPSGTRFSPLTRPGFNLPFLVSVLHHATLPIFSVVLTGVGGQALAMRGNSIQVLGTDYLRIGRIRGLSTWRLASRYVARNAVLPMYTGLMIAIGFMFGGSIILEQIFSYPGVGWYMVKAVQSRDYFLLMGGFLMITLAVLVGIYIADLTYSKIDPRIGANTATGSRRKSRTPRDLLTRLRVVLGRFGSDSAASVETAAHGRVGEVPERLQSSPGEPMTRWDRFRERYQRLVVAPLRVMWSDWRGRVGLVVIVGYLLMGTVGVLVIHRPELNQGPQLVGMFQSLSHPLGTDGFGQDLFAVIVHSTPAMLKMVAAGAVFATSVATLVGSLSGYHGHSRLDRVMMFFTDTMMAIPGLPLIIVVAALFQPKSPVIVGILLSINAWAGLARAIRSEILSLREESYIEASSVMGISTRTIIGKDLLPNVMPYITINFVNAGRAIIYNSVGLYFLGLLPFSQPNWGVMLNFAYNKGGLHSWAVAHWLIVPMAAIIILTLGLTLFAQAADRVFNPRTRARYVDSGTESAPDQPPE